MLVEARHDLDEIAGPVAVIELVHQDLIPAVTARARRSWQAEDVSGAGNAGRRAGLDRRGADLGVADHQKQRGEAVHTLFEQRLDRLRGYVAAGKAVPSVGDDDIDRRIRDPVFDTRADGRDVVA